MIDLKPHPAARERYYQAGYWQHHSLAQRIAASVDTYPDKTAVSDASGHHISYRELDDQASRLAAFWQARGLGVGDVVTMHLPNWWQTAVVTLAAFKLGAVINPLPPTYGWKDLAFIMNKSGSKAVVVAGHFRSVDYTEHLQRIAPELQVQPSMVVIRSGQVTLGTPFDEAVSGPLLAQAHDAAADDPALLLFTSGSESKPKGVVHTHNTALYGERALSDTLALDHRDVCFMASPVTHTSGFMHGILLTLMTGATVSLLDIFKGDTAVDQMLADRATWTMGATPFLSDVVDSLERSGKRLPDLRYFLCGGAPIPEVLVRRAHQLGVRVMSIYGSTESPPHTVTWPTDPIEAAWQFDGRALPGVEVCAVDEDGKPLPPGQQGEQWSRGPHAFLGYLGEPELTAKALDADGWYHSGDLATVGAQGAVRIVGRIKDMIIRGGQNISAREVEDILLEHPACQSVAVIGLPDERLGELGCAVVVCQPGKTLGFEEMKQFLIERGVARFKLPEHLVLRDALPATPSGKVQKFKLREELKSLNGATSHV
ncbi:medium-chain fatty-acid--CoA ligase [Rhodoferax lithotrophicus]|uniref:Medium-chain fatty-acid--CoA ligase n=1 Tax=Rhodoferax lithotrophicus TaxID=2798804 RepID=A0ABM7MTQ5_9BURK|nr:AMP-binding protein [Rhodoferax sp. MIZ03]BCO29572.1 medium-chain fatty-acid--CoA ligase [Rhodoferax sp. MIZ03]